MTQQRYREDRTDTAAVPGGPPARPADAAAKRWPTWVALAVLVIAGLLATLPLRTPAARPASAPTDTFSAARAMDLLDGIASTPHPTGSAAQPQVRENIIGRLRAVGLQPQVTTRTGQAPNELTTLGTMSVVHARIAGTRPTGTVLLVAHYDSVPTGPGAADNGANIAALIEIARVLRAGPAPRNNIDILLTDGEEQGSLGADVVLRSGLYPDPTQVVVVNVEARGNSGPVVMFEALGTGLDPAIRASRAVTTSAASEVYRLLNNGTDLTALHDGGMRGLNFSFFGDAWRYHTARDEISAIQPRTVQDMGDVILRTARELGAADLGVRGGESTYFSIFGLLVSYPGGLVLPLAVLAVAGVLALGLWQRRRGLSPRGLLRAAVTFPLVLIVAPVLVWQGAWSGLIAVRPDIRLTHGQLPGLVPYALAELVIVAVAVIAWYRWVRRRARPVEVATVVAGWFALIGLLLAVLAPGTAYLATWPALIGVAGLAVTLRFARAGALPPAAGIYALAVPTAVLLTPVGVLLVPALGLGLLGVLLVLAALLGAAAAGAAELLPRRRATTAGLAALALAAVAAFAGATVYDREPRPGAPHPVSLGYLLDADRGAAFWVSDGGPGQPAVGPLLTASPRRFDDQMPQLGTGALHNGPAPVSGAAADPQATTPEVSQSGDIRTVRVRLSAPAGVFQLAAFVDTTNHRPVDVTVDGVVLPTEDTLPDVGGGWHWGFLYIAPPAGGVEVVLRIRGSGTVPVRVVAISAGLPDVAGAPVLPSDLHWARWPSLAGQSFVARTFRF
ncbi:M28 family peptidase [Micromonospora sp. RTGN7]|uniref:M28 family peptidase n=1 Tax=Micromonospora sp. RTGN7 TaxID=3016526 RepID=UPI0029FF4821|nr:M28 family peptidase [Micromonospora sp. RTGN7]